MFKENESVRFDYKIVRSSSRGYALLKRANGFWQQVSKWYIYEKNLIRFVPEANMPCYYEIIH